MVDVNFFGRLLKIIFYATMGIDINLDNNAHMFVLNCVILKPSDHVGVTGMKNYKDKK
jgi:hypothetical protein